MENEKDLTGQEKSEMATYLNVSEVAAYLRIPKSEVYILVKKRSFPAVKIGKQWKVNKDALDTWFLNKSRTK